MPKSNDRKATLKRTTNLLRRRNVWTFAALGLGLPVAWILWQVFGWLPAIDVSPQTTWLTKPLRNDGYVDYMSHLRDQYIEKGGISDGDPWYLMIDAERSGLPAKDGVQYVEPAYEYRRSLAAETEMFEREQRVKDFELDILPNLTNGPWAGDEFPVAAATVEKNEAWFQHVRATWTPVSFVEFPVGNPEPMENTAASIALIGSEATVRIVNRFLLRTGYQFGQQQPAKALQDAIFIHKVLRRENLCMVQLLQANSFECRIAAMLAHGMLAADTLDSQVIDLVEQLPSDSMDNVFIERLQLERIINLDYLTCMHRSRFLTNLDMNLTSPSDPYEWIVARQRASSVNWNQLLKSENEFIDQIVEHVKTEDWHVAHQEIRKLCEPADADAAKSSIAEVQMWHVFPGTDTYTIALQKGHQFLVSGHVATARILLSRRIVQLVARLAVWKIRHGSFPDALKPLQNLEGFQPLNSSAFIDPFTSLALVYSTTGSGFSIRSAGPNGKLDTRSIEQIAGDGRRIPDHETDYDFIYSWPVDSDL